MDKKDYYKKVSENLKLRSSPQYLKEAGLSDFISSIFSRVTARLSGKNTTPATSSVSTASRNRASPKGREPLPKPLAKPFNPMQQTLDKASKQAAEFDKTQSVSDRAAAQRSSSAQAPRVPAVVGPVTKPQSNQSAKAMSNSDPGGVRPNGRPNATPAPKPTGGSNWTPNSSYDRAEKARYGAGSNALKVNDPVQAAPLGGYKASTRGATPPATAAAQIANAPKRYASSTGGQQHPPVTAPKNYATPTGGQQHPPVATSPQDSKAAASRAALPSNRVASALDNKPQPKPAAKPKPTQSKTTKQVKKAVQKKTQSPTFKANFKGGFGQKATYRFDPNSSKK